MLTLLTFLNTSNHVLYEAYGNKFSINISIRTETICKPVHTITYNQPTKFSAISKPLWASIGKIRISKPVRCYISSKHFSTLAKTYLLNSSNINVSNKFNPVSYWFFSFTKFSTDVI